ncbi:NADH-dependent formate dehydrogenase delta subunit FdsD [Paracoccus haematequi]|uniref:NADH-dependent formate dehydrogenase delta subunit FdsD n=1 Tax=Paracoccus haematequi TaxID=2491866 RepID=A0A447INK7_9RHOB|nr:formate dehydrogenase subunit delta [Paracoccus haematequi]VDS09087.1 NADH-dependent formate dehydrogenase delta subunit FdsD [Paracoccus haematequi]
MSPEKMVMMANQIATFFDTQPGHAPDKIADHLRDFWEPRMREQLKSYLAQGGAGLRPSVQEAVRHL